MNRDQLRKCIGYRVQLEPVACSIDEHGRELPAENDDWMVENVSDTGVRITNIRTGHATILGLDHIHHFTSNPGRSQGGLQYGFFTLHVQIFLQGNELRVRPNARPSEPVKPPVIEVAHKWVDLRYPADSGLQAKLEAAGYLVAWCLDSKLARKIDLEGWEVVIEPDSGGRPCRYRLKDRPVDQTLIRKRNG